MLKSLEKAYYRLFYWQFCKDKKNCHSSRGSVYPAIVVLTVICFGNFLTALYVVSKFIVRLPKLGDLAITMVVLFFFILNCIIFYRKKKYLEIEKLFCDESDDEKHRNNLLCELFLIYSMFSFVTLGLIFGNPF